MTHRLMIAARPLFVYFTIGLFWAFVFFQIEEAALGEARLTTRP